MALLARNIAAEYVAIGVNLALGVVMLPFNIAHLGASTYGLWILASSVTTYFSMLDLGYGSAQGKFTAQYRALRDASAINQVVSTTFVMFLGVACVSYAGAAAVAFNLGRVFNLSADQAAIGRDVLLIVSLYVAVSFPCSVFGSVVNAFQTGYVNNVIAISTSITVAMVNVAILRLGYGVVTLVAATTAVRLLSLIAYRWSAYRAFPHLSIRWEHASKSRLREVTALSIFMLIIDVAAKINLSADTMVIGAFMSTAAITVWTVAHRLTDVARMLSGVLTHFLFPMIVDEATRNRLDNLQRMLLEGTRLSLVAVIPLASVAAALAHPLVIAWVGPKFMDSVPVIYVLAVLVAFRTGTTTSRIVLKGTERHRFLALWSVVLAVSNLALSIALVRSYGLIGVAFGTLVPVVAISGFVVFPAACRRVELPVSVALRRAVWPAIWPAAVPCGGLLLVRDAIGANLIFIAIAGLAAGLLYAASFLSLAIERDERRWYLAKVGSVLGRRIGLA